MDINAKQLTGGLVGTCISALGIDIANLQSIQSIVAIVCTAFGAIVTLITSVIIPLAKWWINAKKDGKIDAEELDELEDTLNKMKGEINNDDKKH